MNDVIDLHTHTLVSGHAYNTIREMTRAAKDKGLSLLGISEHAPKMPGSCHEFYFSNLRILDRNAYDVPVLFGVELNICGPEGEVDLPVSILETLDYGIASLHPPCFPSLSEKETTHALIRAIENPYVNIIGHPDDGRFPLCYDEIAAAAKEHNVLLEINNSSLCPTGFRPNARENYFHMLEACRKYGTQILLGSDAHADTLVGAHDYALALAVEAGYPETLILNDRPELLLSMLRPHTA